MISIIFYLPIRCIFQVLKLFLNHFNIAIICLNNIVQMLVFYISIINLLFISLVPTLMLCYASSRCFLFCKADQHLDLQLGNFLRRSNLPNSLATFPITTLICALSRRLIKDPTSNPFTDFTWANPGVVATSPDKNMN